MVLSQRFKLKSHFWLTRYCSAAGYHRRVMPEVLLPWRNSTEDKESALPPHEGTSLAPCKQLREQPGLLGGAPFFPPEMKPVAQVIKFKKNHNNLRHIKNGNGFLIRFILHASQTNIC